VILQLKLRTATAAFLVMSPKKGALQTTATTFDHLPDCA